MRAVACRAGAVALLGAALFGAACAAGSESSPPAVARGLPVSASGCSTIDEIATGVAVGEGLVLTVAHVLRGATGVRVAGRQGRVVVFDRRADAAIVAVDDAGTIVPLATADRPSPVWIGLRAGVRRATIDRLLTADVDEPADGTAYRRHALELQVEVEGGDSGAPVLNAEGGLVGMVFARSQTASGRAYAVAADELRPLIVAARADGPSADVGRCG
jgi:S1-C subfamily serine protease